MQSYKKIIIYNPLFTFIFYLCRVNEPVVHIITKECDLPELDNTNFFHSRQLFEIARQTPRQKPYMIVAKAPDGQILAHMLSIVRYRTSWFPPYLYMHCRLLGEGVYTYSHEGYTENALFGMMLDGLRNKLSNRVLYIEVSNLSQKMFGYRELKQRQFFPVHWMSIHNSLHSHTPEERISKRLQKHIDNAYAHSIGIRTASISYDPTGVADYSIMMMLMGLRKIMPIIERGIIQDYSLKGKLGRHIQDCTVGIIGTGRIGAKVIEHLSGFGCKMLCYDIKKNDAAAKFAEYTDLDTIYKNCDIISLHVPGLQ